MKTTNLFAAVAASLLSASAALAGDAGISITDAYARSSNPKVGAAFMQISNGAGQDDRLIAAQSDIAARVELHTHEEQDGVMRMVHVEEGFAIPANGMAHLKRGGQHVMLMGLAEPLAQGDTVTVTLTFEQAGDVTIDIPVDNERQPAAGAHGS